MTNKLDGSMQNARGVNNLKGHSNELKCKFCNRTMQIEHRAYLSNPFCSECYENRLEAAGSIDLRDNHRLIVHGSGYVTIEPIDKNKKFKKKS